jgi:hypothetical protein
MKKKMKVMQLRAQKTGRGAKSLSRRKDKTCAITKLVQ